MNATTNRKPRQSKPLAPVCGTVKVVAPIGTIGKPEQQTGEININGKLYYCRCLSHGYQLVSFDTRKQQSSTYDLPSDLSSCDCADATFRNDREGGCKHRKALTALRAAGKLPQVEALPTGEPVTDLAYTDEQADEMYADYLADCR